MQGHLQGNVKLNPLCKNTKVFCCAPMYPFITRRMASDSTSTLQAHTWFRIMYFKFVTVLVSFLKKRHAYQYIFADYYYRTNGDYYYYYYYYL